MKIPINEIKDFYIGNYEDTIGATGVTAIIAPQGAVCGIDVRGGGPASRETELLSAKASAQQIHAVVLGGGSAFGLDAAGGVMKYLEEHDIGFDTGVTRVPLVCQSGIFDLVVGDKMARPDSDMGYKAAKCAFKRNYKDGNYGVGMGATVGKLCGTSRMMKSGVGSAAVRLGNIEIGAVVAVNALGDVIDDGKIIAGLLSEDKKSFANTAALMSEFLEPHENKFVSNTTIGAVFTNAAFTKNEASKLAAMAQNGIVRAINPVNLSVDGDTVYAMSGGDEKADLDVLGTIAADLIVEAVICAVRKAESLFGIPCAKDMNNA